MLRQNLLHRYLSVALVALLVGAFVAACSDDDDDADTTPGSSGAVTTASPGTDTDTTPGTDESTAETTGTAGMAMTPGATGTSSTDTDATAGATGTADATGTPAATGTSDASTTTTPSTTGTPDRGNATRVVSVEDILENMQAWSGQQVLVAARVADVIDEQTFEVRGGSNDTLRVTVEGETLPEEFSEGALVILGGTLEGGEDSGASTPGATGTAAATGTPDTDSTGTPGTGSDSTASPDSTGTTSGGATGTTTAGQDGDAMLVADSVTLVAPAAGGPIDQIHDDVDEWVGETVVFVARVSEVVDGRGFVVGAQRLSNDMLVVTGDGATGAAMTDATEDAWVRVSGTVEEFTEDNAATWDDAFSNLFDDDTFADWEGEPVVLADSFEVIAPANEVEQEEIADDVDAFAGQDVSVTGFVDRIHSSGKVFSLEGDADLLVVAPDSGSDMPLALMSGLVVLVNGTVEEFDPSGVTSAPGAGSTPGTGGSDATGTPGTGTGTGTGTSTTSATGTPDDDDDATGTSDTDDATGTTGSSSATGTRGTGTGTATGTPGTGSGLDSGNIAVIGDADLSLDDLEGDAAIIASSIEIIAIDD